MKNYFTIGSVPYDELCAQIDVNNYEELSRIECTVYKEQLIREYGFPKLCILIIRTFPHNLGTEVCVDYDDESEESYNEALEYETGCLTWDEISLERLKELNYSL